MVYTMIFHELREKDGLTKLTQGKYSSIYYIDDPDDVL